MGRAYGISRMREMFIGFRWENLRKRDVLEDWR
jgi:hypothetical protein